MISRIIDKTGSLGITPNLVFAAFFAIAASWAGGLDACHEGIIRRPTR